MGLSMLTPPPPPGPAAPAGLCHSGEDWASGVGVPGPGLALAACPHAPPCSPWGPAPTWPFPASLSPCTPDAPHALQNGHRWSEPLDINFQIKNEIAFQSLPLLLRRDHVFRKHVLGTPGR